MLNFAKFQIQERSRVYRVPSPWRAPTVDDSAIRNVFFDTAGNRPSKLLRGRACGHLPAMICQHLGACRTWEFVRRSSAQPDSSTASSTGRSLRTARALSTPTSAGQIPAVLTRIEVRNHAVFTLFPLRSGERFYYQPKSGVVGTPKTFFP